jgi:OFA family oxalate/formate antiporter-like MFS transporter
MGKLGKWIHGAIPALCIHCTIGSVYAWSLLVNPVTAAVGMSVAWVQFAFSLAIFFLGMSAAFLGKLVEHNIKLSSRLCVLFFCGGLLVTALGSWLQSIWLIYLGYGVLMGCGLGIGYLTPIKNLMLWFTEHKGVATGIAIMGFGFASTIATPILTFLLETTNLTVTFLGFAAISVIPLVLASILIKRPPNYVEQTTKDDFKVLTMFKDNKFRKIWLMFFLNIACGLALISIASPLLVSINCGPGLAATAVAIMGICNGLGRLTFSAISDKLNSRVNIYLVIFLISVATMVLMLLTQNIIVTIIGLCIISSTYGAGFSNMPTLLSDIYGMNRLSAIHGLSLTAWGIAGLVGNNISSIVFGVTGAYMPVLWVLLGLYTIGFTTIILLKRGIKK